MGSQRHSCVLTLLPVGAVAVPLTVDCAATPAIQLSVLRQRGACLSAGAVHPNNSVPGTCGTVYLYGQNLNNGDLALQEGGWSDLGPIATINYNIHWDNQTNGGGGNVGGALPPNDSPTQWGTSDYVTTNVGTVKSTMKGNAILVDGTVCTFRPGALFDYTTVTAG